ncbi:CAP domain-containing protein [Oscillibacter sp.]|uniref:CAP domain-containing protein n=1 Tax=Oscillibacter sp. TaxID=1945593 RepID=UPI0026128939|nr:CAP domain-containing protein [Oscillibacter sp.]MDD3347869.1 CAP domain-containing protein [Oscillibacter sp.]
MKKVRTYLVAAALAGAALTIPAGAASLNVSVFQGNVAQAAALYPACQLTLPEILNDCLGTFLPGQTPGCPGGGTLLPDQTPSVPDGDHTLPDGEAAPSNYEAEVVRLVNDARQENGLQPLTASAELSHVARVKSQDMVDHHYFSHTSPTYGTPSQMLTNFGVSYSSSGENIAYGQRTPQKVVATWMNSPGHRANILSAAYTQIGVGYVADGNYWTQLFIG